MILVKGGHVSDVLWSVADIPIVQVLCVCVCFSLLIGNPNFKKPYLLAGVM